MTDVLIQNFAQVMSPTEQEDTTSTEDNQITEIEGHAKTLSYNQSLLSSTQDSIESIATPQEAVGLS